MPFNLLKRNCEIRIRFDASTTNETEHSGVLAECNIGRAKTAEPIELPLRIVNNEWCWRAN